jgi:O-antigen/teichoic acid export membrane protein
VIICAILIIKECGVKFHFKKVKDMYLYSYPYLFNGALSAVTGNADRFLLKAFLSMDAVGIYGLAMKLAVLLREFIIEPFQRSFGAFRFSIMKQDDAAAVQSKTLNYLAFIVAWAGLALSLFAGDLVHLLATKDYYGSIEFIPVIVLSIIIGSWVYVFETGILYTKKTIKLFYANTITGIGGLVFFYFLIKYLGIYGACISLIIQAFLLDITINWFSQRLYRIKYEYNKLVMVLVTAIVLFLAEMAIPNLNFVLDIVVDLALLVLYPVILYRCKFFSDAEISIAKEFAQKFIEKVKDANSLSS